MDVKTQRVKPLSTISFLSQAKPGSVDPSLLPPYLRLARRLSYSPSENSLAALAPFCLRTVLSFRNLETSSDTEVEETPLLGLLR